MDKFRFLVLVTLLGVFLLPNISFADFNIFVNQSFHEDSINMQNGSNTMHYGLSTSSDNNLGFEYLWKFGSTAEMTVGLGQYNRNINRLKTDYLGSTTYLNLSQNLPISGQYLYFHYNHYFLKNLYGIAGLNFNMAAAMWGNSVASPESSGKLGYELGLGYRLFDSFRVEAIYQVLNSGYIAGTDHSPTWATTGTKISTSSNELSLRVSYKLF